MICRKQQYLTIIVIILIVLSVTLLSSFFFSKLPSIEAKANVDFGKTPLEVQFSVHLYNFSEKIEGYTWDFGDGMEAIKKNCTHIFYNEGEYTVQITVQDVNGNKYHDAVEIKTIRFEEPIAMPSANITSGKVPLQVGFNGIGYDVDGEIQKYNWEFGDGHSSDLQNPTYEYKKNGIYHAQLEVIDNDGQSAFENIIITVYANSLPFIYLHVDPIYTEDYNKIHFKAISSDIDGYIESYRWEFSDGEIIDNGASEIYKTFKKAGEYTATVTVKDNNGGENSSTVNVVVGENDLLNELILFSLLVVGKVLLKFLFKFIDNHPQTLTYIY